MQNSIIGRKEEIALLEKYMSSNPFLNHNGLILIKMNYFQLLKNVNIKNFYWKLLY